MKEPECHLFVDIADLLAAFVDTVVADESAAAAIDCSAVAAV
jgi:hypothetical protein